MAGSALTQHDHLDALALPYPVSSTAEPLASELSFREPTAVPPYSLSIDAQKLMRERPAGSACHGAGRNRNLGFRQRGEFLGDHPASLRARLGAAPSKL
jgi:hypothetical protein